MVVCHFNLRESQKVRKEVSDSSVLRRSVSMAVVTLFSSCVSFRLRPLEAEVTYIAFNIKQVFVCVIFSSSDEFKGIFRC